MTFFGVRVLRRDRGAAAHGERVWTAAAPDAFLKAPEEFAPGTAMIWIAGGMRRSART
jgi:cytochrome c2